MLAACAVAASVGVVTARSAATDMAQAHASCSAAEKQRRTKQLSAFQRQMPAKRKAYFKTHKSARARKAFVRQQQARLQDLQRRVKACKVAPRADLSLQLVATPSSVLIGEELKYTATIRNAGPSRAAAVRLDDTLPAGASMVSSTATAGSCVGLVTSHCTLGALERGAIVKVTIVVTADEAGTLENSASASSSTVDPNPRNNKAAVTVSVTPQADVSLTLAAAPGIVVVGQTVTYTASVGNAGPNDATGVTLVDSLPAGTSLVSAATTRGSCAAGVHCDLGTLQPGDAVTVTIAVTTTQAGNPVNLVAVSTQTEDPNHANDAASASVAVLAPLLPPSTATCSPTLANGTNTFQSEGPTDYTLHQRALGNVRAIMLFVDFPDAPASETTTSLYDLLVPGAQHWFSESSYGRMSLDVTAAHTWFRMPHTAASYDYARGFTFAQHRAYIADAIHAADGQVDFRGYSIFYVVATNTPLIPFSPAFNAYPGTGVTADGNELRNGSTLGADIHVTNWAWRVVTHETGHLLGLPDLYDFATPTFPAIHRFVGNWDVMGRFPGGQYLAWHKWKLGWLDPDNIRCLYGPGQLEETVAPIETPGGVKALVVPVSASKAYVVEVRRQTGVDTELCDHGVLVYTVDATVLSGYGPVVVQAASSAADPALPDHCGPLYHAPFDLGAGEAPTFDDANVRVDVLATDGSAYRVRVTRK
ncbi:MAG: M6 family metalloprotease domain-containing protein [Gaiellaceae bacterium]